MKSLMRHLLSLGTATAVLLTFLLVPVSAAVDDMDAVSLAERYIGKDYELGGETPGQGFDSSGLVYYIFNRVLDYNVPRNLDQQSRMNEPKVNRISDLKYGDIIFFGEGSDPSFAGIYTGNRKFVMANYTHDKVMRRSLTGFYKDRFMFARRVLSKADHARAKVMIEAQKHLGTPYEFGARVGQTRTFDCSSFTKHVFNQLGYYLPRVSKNQAKRGKYVSKSNLKVGDLVFFTTPRTGKEIGHVAIYAGNGQMIHTYGDGGVKFTPLDKPYWKKRYVTARRIIQD